MRYFPQEQIVALFLLLNKLNQKGVFKCLVK